MKTDATQPAFEVRSVTYRVGAATILENVSIDVFYGRVLALVGPNGAGKSSLLGVLTADITPTGGGVLLDGRTLALHSATDLARTRSVLLQSNQVSFAFSAHDVVEMGRAPWTGAVARDDEAMIANAMRRADVSHLADRPFSSLSGGERARVSLARVLAQDTRIVLLDEPTAALDLRHQEDVLRIARDLAADGRAVIVVLHDLSLAAAYADEVAMIDVGRLVAHGTPAEVFTAERIGAVYGTAVRVVSDVDTGRPIVLPRRSA
ncbi:iron complex transport system ATP-binding protein [Microbacterium endophyticum]|uniref:Iron complex transport system ATP-binding protein n=1 Tax=Microbacterium endophyticum TaxID=1526412 RepID=A0A7W4YN36_9MICO|nr:heme ABC transporter ATP-binding protein [Microbacterium endophyticum]MBB2977095.1 iron complex transport system ATP-binding protein [Microbacterium endophyticum]NIK36111.1 iron complex transport system ATP-binding protein [Microbacterium endophyticum]